MIREIDELQLYFGEDYHVNDNIHIHQPTIGEIMSMGERDYYSMIYSITSIPSDRKSQLFDIGIDYETISDFEMFIMYRKTLSPLQTKIILGDIDLSKFEVCKNKENDEIVLYDFKTNIVIDRLIYQIMIDYIRKMHSLKPNVEKAGNEYTKKILIEEDRMKLKMKQDKPYQSVLLPLISAMVNHEGFKYNLQQVKNIKIYEFMDSVHRIQIMKSADALLSGIYGGNVDTSKINKKELNWLRELND